MGKDLSKRPLDIFFFIFFLLHIPITLLIDIQAILPRWFFPTMALRIIDDVLIGVLADPNYVHPNPWFQSLIWCELLLQFPFFFVALYGIYKGANWVINPINIYCAHVLTTLIPIFASIISSSDAHPLLWIVYAPWALVPVIMLWRFSSKNPFGDDIKAKKNA